MIRALYAGVSGLMSHSIKLDVIGNNIANVNTYGFKSGRVTFAEALAQRIGTPYAPYDRFGGVNPVEVGLGTKVSSIDNNFSQGNLLSSGIITDLALQGDGFFVLNDGIKNYYTRAGAFQIDAQGNLVAQGGLLFVQGKMADINGNIPTGTSIENINLPFGQKEPAHATTEVNYFCNLNADSNALAEIWTANEAFTTFASVTGGATPTTPMTIDDSNDQFNISVDGGLQTDVSIAQGTYNDVDALVQAINDGLTNAGLSNAVVALKIDDPVLGELIEFRTVSTGASSSIALYDAGEGFMNIVGITSGASGTGIASASTLINDLAEVTNSLVAGDTISISGTDSDGSSITGTYTYADGHTVQDLLDSIDSTFTGATASLNSAGKVVLIDNLTGESSTTISLSSGENQGTFSLPTFSNTIAGRDYGSHSTSIDVYDSLGTAHNIEMAFTKAAEENVWNWSINVDSGLTIPASGDSGTITFNDDGSLANFIGGPLVFTPPGAQAMSVDLDPGTPGTFNGITQFDSPSTTIALEQNGYSMGELEDISIEVGGIISGTFSNGVVKTLGQIAIADFNNPAGLTKAGNNLYNESANSGGAVFGWAQTNFNTTINSGYLEMSNVDLTREFTELIVAQRGFQANARVIQTSDMVLAEINGLKR